ncbi:multicopper oxidase family protein [Paenibacillus alkalitolerans]|uniref:multicopper oxidase family protein n=1 Tax=Paenibacillus alkalitolerans TaxID=2799335 RepID=UPI0018F46C0C|nr:multicopper oxidase family protein [Paenibacillus alkalitolerans]
MFETFASIILTITMTVLWLSASFVVTGLPYSKNYRLLKRSRTFLLWVSCMALIIGVLWYAVMISLWLRNGWLFVEGTFKAVMPFMLIMHLCIVISALPKIIVLRNSPNREELTQDTLIKITHPALPLSYYAAVLTSGLAASSNIFAQPVLPGPLEIVQRIMLILLILIVPALFVIRRHLAAARGGNIRRSLGLRLLKFMLASVLTSVVVIAVVVTNVLAGVQASKLPEASDMMNHNRIDEGGGTSTLMADSHNQHNHNDQSNTVEVAALTGDISAPADVKFELTAQRTEIELSSGARMDAWTYNGEIAPELRVRHGDMVEVKLINKDIDKGVTIHWHGYNVPNAMDGVPGMTQNIVKPGQSFTYKFRAEQEGTYWFHSHQQAAEQVAKGLFGSLIVEPKNETDTHNEEITVINHRWKTDQGYKHAFGNGDGEQLIQVSPGKKVKLRIINTHKSSQKYLLQGVEYRIESIDGVRIELPGLLSDETAFSLGSGGRYDVTFTMPDHPVLFKMGDYKNDNRPSIIIYTENPPVNPSFKAESELFDPSNYGKAVVNEETSPTRFDREFLMILGNRMGFYNGKFHFLWTINGEVHPNVPTLVVKEGEKVKTTFVNKSLAEHPMHLHGHHMTVLKKNGKKVKTSWLTDTLNVRPGETYEVAFIANNPGMWMDHCHNLDHAATGMILHLMYDHVRPSFEVGTRSGNLPD